MIPALLLALVLAQAPAPNGDEVDAALEAWTDCVIAEIDRSALQERPRETVVSDALDGCTAEESEVRSAWIRSGSTPPVDEAMRRFRDEMRESGEVRARRSLVEVEFEERFARARRTWVGCVVAYVVDKAPIRALPAELISERAFRSCRRHEARMREALASGRSAEEVEDFMTRARAQTDQLNRDTVARARGGDPD